MKNILLIIVFAATVFSTTAQNFNEVGNLKHVTETVVTSYAFQMIAGIENKDSELIEAISKLKDLRIYSTDDPISSKKMAAFAQSYISKKNMELLMSVKEEGQKFSFHVTKGKTATQINDLVMLINEGEGDKTDTVFLVVSGDIDLNQLAKITGKMNIPGQKQIEKATKSN